MNLGPVVSYIQLNSYTHEFIKDPWIYKSINSWVYEFSYKFCIQTSKSRTRKFVSNFIDEFISTINKLWIHMIISYTRSYIYIYIGTYQFIHLWNSLYKLRATTTIPTSSSTSTSTSITSTTYYHHHHHHPPPPLLPPPPPPPPRLLLLLLLLKIILLLIIIIKT